MAKDPREKTEPENPTASQLFFGDHLANMVSPQSAPRIERADDPEQPPLDSEQTLQDLERPLLDSEPTLESPSALFFGESLEEAARKQAEEAREAEGEGGGEEPQGG